MPTRVSLVISTLNEEGNIGDCIRSATGFADEVIVVDMASADRTADEARAAGAIVHTVQRASFVDPTRNYALSMATGDWILLLDADERLTPKLLEELRRIAINDEADVVFVYMDTYMFGQQIRFSGWQKNIHPRFFKKGYLEYPTTEVHAAPKTSGRIMVLDPLMGMIQHLNFRDLHHFVEKLNVYTDGEAIKLLKSNGPLTPLRGIYWGLRQFLKRYFKLKGFKDGKYGFILSVFMGFYWFLAFSKAWEQTQRIQKNSHRD